MSKLYIANCTYQNYDFNFWLPESTRHYSQPVPMGGQIAVGGLNRDLPQGSIDSVISQHQKYNLVSADEAQRTGRFSGMVYSVDKPIKLETINHLMERHKGNLHDRGKEFRENAAVATNQFAENALFEQQMPDQIKSLEMTVETVSRPNNDDVPEVAEGIRVTREAHGRQGPMQEPPRRGRPAKARY